MKESMYNIWMEGDNGAKLCYNAFASGFAELDKETYKFFMKCASNKIDPNNFTDKEKESYEQFKRRDACRGHAQRTGQGKTQISPVNIQSNSLGYTLLPQWPATSNAPTVLRNKNLSACPGGHRQNKGNDD